MPTPDERRDDRLAIAELMTAWIHRDLGHWDQLHDVFAPGATVEITWFRGPATDFIQGSRRMGAGDLRTKHLVTSPVVTFSRSNPRRAFVETNAAIIAEHRGLRLGTTTHNRFLDQVEKQQDGHWRIVHRASSYDMGCLTYPWGVESAAAVDPQGITRFPSEYAALAYLLEAAGFPVTGSFPTRGSELERHIRDAALAWIEE